MFCMGCGAETPSDADRCPVCGRAVARIPGEPTVAPVAQGAPSTPLQPAAYASAPSSPVRQAGAPLVPSITGGELDAPGFPRDAAGRALLITVFAMMLDLLAPWVNLFGRRSAPAEVGAPALVVVLVLAAALVPLSRPSLRRQPATAVLPLVVGALAFGAAGLLWGYLTILASRAPSGDATGVASSLIAIPVADFGLYLFLFGAGILIYTGYQMFLIAARAGVAASPTQAPIATSAVARHDDPSAPVAAPLDVFADDAAPQTANGIHPPAASAARPVQAPLAPSARPQRELALPGTPDWNAMPQPPHVVRPSPSAGWRGQGNPRHP